MSTHAWGRVLAGLFAGTLLVFAVGCGSSDSGGSDSSQSLEARLPPASVVPGYHVQRTFDWTDPINLVGEGISLPAATRPADAVQVFRDAHLQSAAGENLAQGTSALDESIITAGVAQFPSQDEATTVRDWMHSQDAQQPCYGECIYSPTAFTIPGIPTAKAVEQQPSPGALKSNPTISSHFSVEFTDGTHLHWIALDAPHSAAPRVVAGVTAYYKGLADAAG